METTLIFPSDIECLSDSAIDLMNKFDRYIDNLPLDAKDYDEDYLFLELIDEEDLYDRFRDRTI